MSSETIAAISTAPGRGAVGIVRLSGDQALIAAGRIFTADDGRSLADCPPGQMVLGKIRDEGGAVVDHALAVTRRAPRSYTGEDMAELHCHGSPALLLLVLESLLQQGARMALPGEFTRRAFLNGRLDLTEAEAVGDLIDADSELAVKNAAAQLGGVLARRIEEIYDPLLTTAAHFHAVLDYPDEDLDAFSTDGLQQTVDDALARLASLRKTYDTGRLYAGGIPCAIVGAPNSGKSSLLNALLGYDRAIVTDIAGTTRDTVEERVSLGGVSLRLIDTAGLRQTADAVEALGVARSRQAMEAAALVLWVVDGSRPLSAEDKAVQAVLPADVPVVKLLNKQDLGQTAKADGLPISAKTGAGLDALEAELAALFPAGAEGLGSVLTNARQLDAALRGEEALTQAAASLRANMPPDAIVADLELALEALGQLNGKSLRDDMVTRIFEKFCVGK